jgi:ABC-2 type transport system ATP-binding protein
MAEDIIITDSLSKRYKEVVAVSGLSLRVRKGEVYGFLGLNGAGKTTTIRMLLGMIHPTSGAAFINGKKVNAGNCGLWKETGYIVEVPHAYPNLTVRENLEIVRRLRFIQERSSVDEVMTQLRLNVYAYRKARNLSLGNAQRLGLAKALLHHPSILILDEPANGLDPAGIFEIRELLRGLAANRGVTVFISSHILGEVSKFATRIGIIHEGKLIQEVDAGELERFCRKRLLINVTDQKTATNVLKQKGYPVITDADGLLECDQLEAIRHPDIIATILVQTGCPPTLLQVKEEDLESYFLRTIRMQGGAS